MKIRIIQGDELRRVNDQIIRQTPDLLSITVIGGDRLRCCDEGIICEDDHYRGIATIAPHGEFGNGMPTIVGVFVRPDARRSGVGLLLMEAAVRRCLERGFEEIRVDAVTIGGLRVVEKLPADLRAHIDLHDQSGMYPSFLFEGG